MPEAGGYLVSNVGFTREQAPYISLQHAGTFTDFAPLDHSFTISIDTTQRYCIGWGDIRTGERFSCPDSQMLDPKYEQCPACQKRTGFNPAFYNATSVSTQQEERNLQPHILYLAHFSSGVVKVGISLAARGTSRLLEQGARSALILDTFPTAHIARQYEAKLARLPNMNETIQLRKKIELLAKPYDHTSAAAELRSTKEAVERAAGTTFTGSSVLSLDAHYFPKEMPALHDAIDCSSKRQIAGNCTGSLGSLLFCEQQGTPLFLPLKKYTGYRVMLSHDVTHIELPARQASLF